MTSEDSNDYHDPLEAIGHTDYCVLESGHDGPCRDERGRNSIQRAESVAPLEDRPMDGTGRFLEAQQGYRWAAFTDDELDMILDGLNFVSGAEPSTLHLTAGLAKWQRVRALALDVRAELERRKP